VNEQARWDGELLRLVVECATDYAIFALDPAGRVTLWSPGAERMMGYPEREMLGRDASIIFTPEDLAAGAADLEMRTAMVTGRAENERWHLRRDGSRFWASGLLHTMHRDDGEPVGFVKIMRDFTERRRSEAAVQEVARSQTIGVLAGGVAHNFNNLLTAVVGNATLALRHRFVQADPDLAGLLTQVIEAAQRGAELTHRLRAYTGRQFLQRLPLDLAQEAGEVREFLGRRIARGIEVRVTVAEGCPPVEADPVQVHQLIADLILNAVEAMGDCPGTLGLTTAACRLSAADAAERFPGFALGPGEYVSLSVSDTGHGIDEATREHIFEPFFTTKFLGRGMGLATALGVVKAHGGGIRVESAPGQGATFEVVLPAASRGQTPPPQAPGGLAPGRTVLVADDEAQVRTQVAMTLERDGWTVLQAENGEEAVGAVDRVGNRLDLVLLDLAMPMVSGPEALGTLHARWPQVPIVAMTGYGDLPMLRMVDRAAVSAFLHKPFTAEQLRGTVQTLRPRD
jgi:PAS domain S-box-containing protein